MKNKLIAFGLGFAFFVLGVITLPHYGINWDTINHLPRGQAYLHFFLTGRKDYSDLEKAFVGWPPDPKIDGWYWQNPNSLKIDADIALKDVPTRSFYQNDSTTYEYFMKYDGKGHPPLSDILSSVFNRILFGKLRLVNDIDSYRIYGVLLAATLVGLIYYWVQSIYGGVAGLVAAVALSTYPLFWAESHFNTEKDIPETVFWSFLLYSVWRGITSRSWKWILASGIFFGLALGTKFNIVFVGFVLVPWLLVYWWKNKFDFRKDLKFIGAGMVAMLIGFVIFVTSWPYLWPDVLGRIPGVIGFYKGIGVSTGKAGILNSYAVGWIYYSTPVVVLLLSGIGVLKIIFGNRGDKHYAGWLFLLWLVVPIGRVTMPGMSIYGGVRQIMEYIPALAIMAGVGGGWVWQQLNKKMSKIASLMVLLLPFVLLILSLIKIHPSENVYVNRLSGGLSGAKERNIPYWGNTFGAAYRQGVSWLNDNAEDGAKIVFAFELIPNFPRIWLRQDLSLHNSQRSGYLREGEYAITLTYQGTRGRSYYDSYLEDFLEPVYEMMVDGVSVLKIWKNDEDHLKKEWNELRDEDVEWLANDEGLSVDLGEVRSLSRLDIVYSEIGCEKTELAFVRTSIDGTGWTRLYGQLPRDWLIPVIGMQPKNGEFIEPFVGQEAQYIDISISPQDACFKNVVDLDLYYFSDGN